jgi:hypothetical protein
MNYVSRITADHWSAKNKLEAAAKLVAQHMDHMLIPDREKDKWFLDFKNAIDKVNADHPKCKELQLSVWGYDFETKGQKPTYITISGVFQMELFEVREYLA